MCVTRRFEVNCYVIDSYIRVILLLNWFNLYSERKIKSMKKTLLHKLPNNIESKAELFTIMFGHI